jgi:ABC-type phosphate/phosphonate transport system substrate-binding protein
MFKRKHKNLDDYHYQYVGNHIDVVFYTTVYNNAIGDVKSSIAEKYRHFIKVIDTSIHIPSFSLIANTQTLNNNDITKITTSFLKAPTHSTTNPKIIQHGVIKTPKHFYKLIEQISQEIKVK